MNEVDVAVILIIGISIVQGIRRGLLVGLIDLVSLLLALAIGTFAWRLPAALFRAFGFPAPLAGVTGFLVLAVGLIIGLNYLGLWLFRNSEFAERADRVGGGVVGVFFGVLLAALLLMVSGVLPNAYTPIEKSALGMPLVRLAPRAMGGLERIGIVIPKLVMLPTDYSAETQGVRKGMQFLQINFDHLDGAVCMNCRTPVQFLGYQFRKGTLLSPKFRCPKCGRTSDGCQTFNGFHTIYGKCPVDLARRGVRFDCGVWTNGNFIVPHGPCPVDGKEFNLEDKEP
jgi:uncharacterized membrane protein required for colicin V production